MTLTEELAAAETWARGTYHHHWHLYFSDTGNVWAVTPACPDPAGSGTTLTAHAPDQIRQQIADTEWHWDHRTVTP